MPRYAAVLVGSAFLLIFYWRGLSTWFYQDDFGWLHLGPATDFSDLVAILFAPKAHGNIRRWCANSPARFWPRLLRRSFGSRTPRLRPRLAGRPFTTKANISCSFYSRSCSFSRASTGSKWLYSPWDWVHWR